MWNFFRSKKTEKLSENITPEIKILREYRIKCCVCNQSLNNGDLIVVGHDIAHGRCVVIVKEKDESMTVLKRKHSLSIVIDRDDWNFLLEEEKFDKKENESK